MTRNFDMVFSIFSCIMQKNGKWKNGKQLKRVSDDVSNEEGKCSYWKQLNGLVWEVFSCWSAFLAHGDVRIAISCCIHKNKTKNILLIAKSRSKRTTQTHIQPNIWMSWTANIPNKKESLCLGPESLPPRTPSQWMYSGLNVAPHKVMNHFPPWRKTKKTFPFFGSLVVMCPCVHSWKRIS